MTRSFSRMLTAEKSSKLSAQSPACRRNALPAATRASELWRARASPAKTRGGKALICLTARSRSASSGHSGCCAAGKPFQDVGDQSRATVHKPGRPADVTATRFARARTNGPRHVPAAGSLGGWLRRPAGTAGEGRPRRRWGSSGDQDPGRVVSEVVDGPLDEPAGGFGCDAEVLPDLPEALGLTVEQAETGLDRIPSPAVEGVEQLVEQFSVDAGE